MHYYNDKLMFGVSDEKMAEGMKHHLSWGNIVNPTAHAKACTECGRCEEECTQHLPITARLAEMAAWEEQIGA
jgi:predicted aldo/keto reductase-like oxidoreductase